MAWLRSATLAHGEHVAAARCRARVAARPAGRAACARRTSGVTPAAPGADAAGPRQTYGLVAYAARSAASPSVRGARVPQLELK